MYRLTLQRFWGKELNTTCTFKSKFTVLPKSNDSVKYSELKFIPGRKWVPLECNYTQPCIIRHNTTFKQNNKLNCARTGSSIDRHLLILNELYSQRTFPNTAGCKRNKSAELGWKDQMFSAIGSNRHWKINVPSMESTRIWLPPTTTSLYSVMAYQHQTIHDFCLRSNIVYFPQRKVLIFFLIKVEAGYRYRAWKVSHRPFI